MKRGRGTCSTFQSFQLTYHARTTFIKIYAKFLNKSVAKLLQNTLRRCGLKIAKVGKTFQSDHIKPDGDVCDSALDHVYFSSDLEKKIAVETLTNSLSDHVPVMCVVRSLPNVKPYSRKITKRCLKNFSEEKWNEFLENKEWNELENCINVDEMVEI